MTLKWNPTLNQYQNIWQTVAHSLATSQATKISRLDLNASTSRWNSSTKTSSFYKLLTFSTKLWTLLPAGEIISQDFWN